MQIDRNHLLPVLILGPVPDLVRNLMPGFVCFSNVPTASYVKNFWNTAPGKGFFYYAWDKADIEDVIDAVCAEIKGS